MSCIRVVECAVVLDRFINNNNHRFLYDPDAELDGELLSTCMQKPNVVGIQYLCMEVIAMIETKLAKMKIAKMHSICKD